jgi:hypothetical protein
MSLKFIDGEFNVHSLERIGTLDQDYDIGIVRTSAYIMKKVAERNSFVKIISKSGSKKKSIIRIIRAATGGNPRIAGNNRKALSKYEIALQYDDRRALGIFKLDRAYKLRIRRTIPLMGLFGYLNGHSSPPIRYTYRLSWILLIIGAALGSMGGPFIYDNISLLLANIVTGEVESIDGI